MTGILIALALLAVAALGALAWYAWGQKAAPISGRTLAIGTATAALLAVAGLPAIADFWGSAVGGDELARMAAILALSTAILNWLLQPANPSETWSQVGLALLSLCGGLLALAASDLLVLLAGLALCTITDLARRGDKATPAEVWTRLGGLAACLLGVGALYAAGGSSNIADLGSRLWMLAGPRPMSLYLGATLVLGGIALASRLLPLADWLADSPQPADDLFQTLAGNVALARVAWFALGALSAELVWPLAGLALLVAALDLAPSLWRSTLWPQPTLVQRSWLIVGIAAGPGTQGVAAWLAATSAYALVGLLLGSARGWLQAPPAQSPTPQATPWQPARLVLAIPVALALLSQAAIPPSLGFAGRWQTLLAARELSPALFAIAAGIALAGVWPYLHSAWKLLRSNWPAQNTRPPWLPYALSLLAAMVLLLGLYRAPWLALAARIAQP